MKDKYNPNMTKVHIHNKAVVPTDKLLSVFRKNLNQAAQTNNGGCKMKRLLLVIGMLGLVACVASAKPTKAYQSVQTFNGLSEMRVDSVSYSTWTIVGIADPGTLDTEENWIIKRIDSSGNTYWGNTSGQLGAIEFNLMWSSRTTGGYNYGGK